MARFLFGMGIECSIYLYYLYTIDQLVKVWVSHHASLLEQRGLMISLEDQTVANIGNIGNVNEPRCLHHPGTGQNETLAYYVLSR